MSKIIESYTRESGVRNLEREIGSVCRAKAVEYAEAKDAGHAGKFSFKAQSTKYKVPQANWNAEKYKPQLTVEDIEEILGIEKYDEEIAEKTRYFRPIAPSPHRFPAATVLFRAWTTA